MRIRGPMLGVLALAVAGPIWAQEPPPRGTGPAIDATIGNQALQLRYLAPSPLTRQATSDLDYGLLLTENREFVGSAALMFNTNLDIVPGLRLQVGPQGYLALLDEPKKTDIFALAFGANARYDLIPRLGLAVFGAAFYSPGVLTFGNAHNIYDFQAGGEMRFTSRLYGLAGYRWFKFTLTDEPDDRVANEVFAGFRWAL